MNKSLPDFLIIGVMKAGTTSFYSSLIKHPLISSAKKKEIHFFDWHYHKGMSWYRDHFVKKKEGTITGEASDYMWPPHVLQRVYKHLPNVKLIVLLRNPVDRAYSHYQMLRNVTGGMTFEKALEKEEKMVKEGKTKHIVYSYLDRGKYVEQLQRWLKVYPGNQILVIRSEDYFNNPSESLNQTLNFLGLPTQDIELGYIPNKGIYTPMNPSTRKRLVNYFRPYNQRLYKLLGRNMDWDL
ncbi:sulfotransferase domain-containing protein [Melghirimyces profundicolus]|uniref:Sulfotransferase domain-containing protein n=2 Tax=Melghirimyces profundicolus TaxID=1242148 RepID=A0A2T6B228_9BACL|nr:sulfotransferase domain-containing protein [Melghirimyces profundicolus]